MLVTKEWRVRAAAVIQDDVEGRLPSDHWPVLAALELPGGPRDATPGTVREGAGA